MSAFFVLAGLASLAIMAFGMRRGDALLSWFAFILAFILFGIALE